jgi:hypothetical protein
MNFLSLVNDVNGRVNEVPLNQLNFATAGGFYSQAKEAINASLRDINQDSFEWPFNHVTQEIPLVENQVRYNYPNDAKTLNFDSFRIKGVPFSNIKASKLGILDYEEYLDKFVDSEYDPQRYQDTPRAVFRTPDNRFGVYPPPKSGLSLVYEYYRLPPTLVNWDDVPVFPEQFRHVVVDGAMQHVFMFRGDPQSAAVMLEKHKLGIKHMRSIYQNRFEYVRAGYIPRSTSGRGF